MQKDRIQEKILAGEAKTQEIKNQKLMKIEEHRTRGREKQAKLTSVKMQNDQAEQDRKDALIR